MITLWLTGGGAPTGLTVHCWVNVRPV